MAEPVNTSYKISNVRKYQSTSNRRDQRGQRRERSREARLNARQTVKVKSDAQSEPTEKDGGVAKRVAGRWIIVGALGPLLPAQFYFGFITVSGLIAELVAEDILWGIFAGLVPGIEAFAIGYAVSIFIGLLSLAIAYAGFLILKMKPFADTRLLIFIICLAGYFSALLSWFPWVMIWVFVVLWTRK